MSRTLTCELVTGTVRSDRLLHLFEGASLGSLCSQPRRAAATHAGFRAAPCRPCLDVALAGGRTIARERANAWINLQRMR